MYLSLNIELVYKLLMYLREQITLTYPHAPMWGGGGMETISSDNEDPKLQIHEHSSYS